MKTIDEVDLMDDIFMNLVASDPDEGENFCRTLLSVLLQQKIEKVRVLVQRVLPGTAPNLRGVRLDVEIDEYTTDISETAANVYDIEPHIGNDTDFPKALRFRQAKIDSRNMQSGDDDFGHMPNLYVILITDFDPFGKGYMLYTIRNRCIEISNLPYNDGLSFLYFNTEGTLGGSESIRNMLKYLSNSHETAVVDDATDKINKCVLNVRLDPEIRGKYMTFGDRIKREKKESYQEGLYNGYIELLTRQICKRLSCGKAISDIANELDVSEEEVQKVYSVVSKYAPAYDSEKILDELRVPISD